MNVAPGCWCKGNTDYLYSRASITVEDSPLHGELATTNKLFSTCLFYQLRIADTAYFACIQALLFKTGDRTTTHYTSTRIFNEHTSRLRPVAHRPTLTGPARDGLSNRTGNPPAFLIGNVKYLAEFEAYINTSLGPS